MTRRSFLIASGGAAFTAALPACRTQAGLDAQVIILGAGLSGLYAAMLLAEDGVDVLVLEGAPRVGGRMYTLDHGDGITEGGGQQIGASYARVLDVAGQLNVPLYTQTGPGPATQYYLGGDWTTTDGINVPEFPKPFQSTAPGSVLFRLLAKDPGFTSATDWLDAPEAMDISAQSYLGARGFDAPAQALIARSLNANNLGSYSILNLHRSLQAFRQSSSMGATQYVTGGSQRLPEAMAASLPRPVRLDQKVKAVIDHGPHIEVRAGNASLRAEQIISTLPFPALRRVKISATLNTAQTEAMAELPYTQIAQIHTRIDTPYWEADSGAPSMWLDHDLERFFADSGADGSLTGFGRLWLNGDGIAAWPMADRAAMFARLQSELARLRPATDKTLTPLALVDWTTHNPLAGGAYYHWAPGQARRWAKTMGAPAGRLYFAGEHLGILHTGMEAAMESAETVAIRIIEDRLS